jgi:hypothetical protein
VHAGLEVVDRDVALRELARRLLGQPARVGQPFVGGEDLLDLLEVPWRAGQHERIVVAEHRAAEVLVVDPSRAVGDQLVVGLELREVGELAGGPDLEPEVLLRRRYRRRLRR